jgi:uncharacterized protein
MSAAREPVRVVVDTNVWISGMLTREGAPAQLVRMVLQQGRPVFSAPTFAELEDRLWRPKFDRYVAMERRRALLGDLQSIAHWTDIPDALAQRKFSRDPDDDKFIHAALAAEARWLISGDQDLLVLAADLAAKGLRIVGAAEMLQQSDAWRGYSSET